MIEQTTINIKLRAIGNGPPLTIRVRRALKHLLRSHGLRAVSVSDVQPTIASVKPNNAGKGPYSPGNGMVRESDNMSESCHCVVGKKVAGPSIGGTGGSGFTTASS